MRTDNSKPGGGALILVVERDPHVRRLEEYFLDEAGYNVEFAGDGASALERAQALRPRIIISEILVPALDGLSLCRRLKSNPATSAITILIFSILAAEERAREAGADAFMRKPLNDMRLVELVERLLAKDEREGCFDAAD